MAGSETDPAGIFLLLNPSPLSLVGDDSLVPLQSFLIGRMEF
jgi:hypothetical protein